MTIGRKKESKNRLSNLFCRFHCWLNHSHLSMILAFSSYLRPTSTAIFIIVFTRASSLPLNPQLSPSNERFFFLKPNITSMMIGVLGGDCSGQQFVLLKSFYIIFQRFLSIYKTPFSFDLSYLRTGN